MAIKHHHAREIARRMNDETFAQRIAATVMAQVETQRGFSRWVTCAVMAALLSLAAGSLWLDGTENDRDGYEGLSETSANAVVGEMRIAWDDADDIINASFSVH